MANMENNKGQGNQGGQMRCEQCNQSFDSQQRLDDHNKQMHGNR
jgi:hypothetical protein